MDAYKMHGWEMSEDGAGGGDAGAGAGIITAGNSAWQKAQAQLAQLDAERRRN
jgi:hypothetical protein